MPDSVCRERKDEVVLTDPTGGTDHQWSVPFDLQIAVVTAVVAVGMVLGSPGYRSNGSHLAVPIDRLLVEVAIPPLAAAIAGLILLFFLPGYALVAAVRPHRPRRADRHPPSQTMSAASLTLTERVALSFGMSVGILSLLGLGIAVSPWEYSALVVGGFLLLFVLGGALVGVGRGHVSAIGRPRPAFDRATRELLGDDDSTLERAVSVALAVSVVLALGTLTLALVVPNTGEAYTGVTLLTPNGSDTVVAADYPRTTVRNEPEPFVVAIQNREGAAMSYTLVVTEQRVEVQSNSVNVLEERELSRQRVQVPAGQDRQTQTDVAPTMTGSSIRLTFSLYRGVAPAEVGTDTAYRQLYVWVEVRASDPGS